VKENYLKENKTIILICSYISVILVAFLLALISTLIKEDYEIKNQILPYLVEVYDYSTMIMVYIALHLLLAIYFFLKNKILFYICGFIGFILLLLLLYPLVYRV